MYFIREKFAFAVSTGVETSHSTSISTTSYMWSGLHPHYSYSVSVAAATVAGNGPTVESQIQMPYKVPHFTYFHHWTGFHSENSV